MERLVAAVFAAGVLQVLLATADDHYLLSRIAFGSCANQSAPQVFFFSCFFETLNPLSRSSLLSMKQVLHYFGICIARP